MRAACARLLVALLVCASPLQSQAAVRQTLTARTTFDTPALTFDFPAMLIGVAEYEEGPTEATIFATVAGAIIFDLGGRRFNTVTPDYELGGAALRAARKLD